MTSLVQEEEEEVVDVQKLKDETIELLKKVFITVSATKKAVTVEEREVISSAYKKMTAIRRDLVRNPPAAAAVADICECRSKIESHISDICNKLSNLTVKNSYRRHLYHFKRAPTTSQIYAQLKRKASTKQLPKTAVRRKNAMKTQQLQQEDTSMTEEENYLEKLILERKDYDETARFIETSLRMRTTKEDREILRTAYENLISVNVKLHIAILTIEDDETKGKDFNVSSMINNHRSIILKGLSDVCDKMSNMMIKEAYRHHLYEFKTRAKPKKYTQSFINQKESPEIFFDMKGGSGSGSSKSLNGITKQLPGYEYIDMDDFHDHSKCIEEEEERRFGRIGNWDPKYEGTGPVQRKKNAIKTQQLYQDSSMTEEKNYLEKLILEQKDYDETARFIETSLRMHTTKEDREVLRTAYQNLIRVDVKLHIVILSIEENGTHEGKDPNMINNHRAIILKGLSDVCDKVSNLTIKEAYRHHHDEFKTGAKPKKYTQMFINQKESPEIFFDMKCGSGCGSSKSLNGKTKQLPVNEYLDLDDFHDHSKCIEEEEERRFPRYGRICNWDPKYEGTGVDLLHLPKNHSFKQEEHKSYYDRMREACKPPDIFPKQVSFFDIFDDY